MGWSIDSAHGRGSSEKRLLIGGEWVETGDWLEVRSPYSGEVVGRVPKAGAAEARRAIDAAEAAMREPLPGAQAGRDPRSRGGLARPARTTRSRGTISAEAGKPLKAAQRRGVARDVHLHDGGGRGAQARRRDGADGRLAGGRGEARVHAARADRRRRRDLAVQLPAQPRRAQDRARARRGLRGRAEARVADAAVGAPARRARDRGGPAAGLAERARRAARPRSATSSSRTSA